jgi:ABC-2 type transport system permease protein
MIRFWGILAAEWLKTRRTALRWLPCLAAFGLAAGLVWYLSGTTPTAQMQVRAFQDLFETWTALVLPFGIGLAAALAIQLEEQAGSFNGLLGSRPPRAVLYLGKLVLLTALVSAGTALATGLLLAGVHWILMPGLPLRWDVFLGALVLVLAGALPLIAGQLWVSLAWSKGPSIAIGGMGLLAAALFGATSVGNGVWPWVPWAWPVRLVNLAGVFLPGVGLPAGVQPADVFLKEAPLGLVPALALFVLLVSGGIVWFQRWEGRMIYD